MFVRGIEHAAGALLTLSASVTAAEAFSSPRTEKGGRQSPVLDLTPFMEDK